MDIWESAKIVVRRWYITVPILGIFLAAAFFLGGQIDPEYRASASMVILPRNTEEVVAFGAPGGPTSTNPLDYLGGQTTLTALQLTLDTDETREGLAAAGFSPAYTISVDTQDPLMLVEVLDRDAIVAQSTVDELVFRVQEELDALQAAVGAPASELLEIQVLGQTQVPTEDYGARLRMRLILLVVGAMLASGAALLADAWATGRAKRDRGEDDVDDDRIDEPDDGSDQQATLTVAPAVTSDDSDDAGPDDEYDDLDHGHDELDDDQYGEYGEYEDDDRELVTTPRALRSDEAAVDPTPQVGAGSAGSA